MMNEQVEQDVLAALTTLAAGAAHNASMVTAAAAAQRRPKGASYAPVTDAAQLAELRLEGLTDRGDEKVRKGDLRCRPPKHYRETLLPKPLPQFRLSTVEDAARAEDLVMLWAYLTGREPVLRHSEFRFKPETYTTDAVLVRDLKNLPADADAIMSYIKQRFGTKRQPKGAKASGAGGSQQQGKHEKTEEVGGSPGAALRDAGAAQAAEGQPDSQNPDDIDLDTVEEFIDEFLEAETQKALAGEEPAAVRVRAAARALACAAWHGKRWLIADLVAAAGGANSPLPQGLTALHWAARGGVGPAARSAGPSISALIQAGAVVDAADIFGRTSLHYAARLGDIQAMTELLAAGASPAAAARNGATPLHWAAEAGVLDAVLLLLERGAGERVPAQDGASQAVAPCGTALHWAARAGRVDVVQHLLEIARFSADARDWNGATPLHAAAAEWRDVFPWPGPDDDETPAKTRKRTEARSSDYRKTMRLLLAHRARPDAADADGRTALHVAAARGNVSAVTFLLLLQQAGGSGGSGKSARAAAAAAAVQSASPTDAMGWDPLMMAVMGSNPDDTAPGLIKAEPGSEGAGPGPVLALLRRKEFEGALKNRDRRGRTALHLAAVEGKVKVVRELLQAGADANSRDNSGATPMLLAARARCGACVEALLAAGADPNAQDTLGSSALAAAARAGDCGCVEVLLAGGAYVLWRRHPVVRARSAGAGRTPLHDAAEGGHIDVLRRLLAQGADPGAACAAGRTPLHEAARCSHLEVVKALLEEEDIDVDAKDAEGYTPAALVPRGGASEAILRALAASGAAEVPLLSPEVSPSGAVPVAFHQQYNTWYSRFELLMEFVKDQERVPAPDEWVSGFPLGGWVELQREKIRWDEMPEEQLRKVGSAGLELKNWGVGMPWADWLRRVEAHVAATGDLPSPFANCEEDGVEAASETADLGWWCRYQQARRLGDTLTKEQVSALEALPGWTWDTPDDRESRRKTRAEALEPFPMAMEQRVPEGTALYAFVRRMENMKRSMADLQRQARVWGDALVSTTNWGAVAPRKGPSFQEMLQRWAATSRSRAAAAGADPKLPLAFSSFEAESPRLEAWMNIQRARFAQGKLTDAEADAVEAVAPEDFSWDPPPYTGYGIRWQLSWDHWVHLLRDYVSENGALPTYRALLPDGGPLGWWASTQRRLCARGKRSAEHRALAAIPGWKESVKKLKATLSWQKSLELLRDYVSTTGKLPNERSELSDERRLGKWVSSQRRLYEQGELSTGRRAALEEIPGWEEIVENQLTTRAAEVQPLSWNDKLEQLRAYVAETGALPSSVKLPDALGLGDWVSEELHVCAQEQMETERRAALAEIPGWEEAVDKLKARMAEREAEVAVAWQLAKAPTPSRAKSAGDHAAEEAALEEKRRKKVIREGLAYFLHLHRQIREYTWRAFLDQHPHLWPLVNSTDKDKRRHMEEEFHKWRKPKPEPAKPAAADAVEEVMEVDGDDEATDDEGGHDDTPLPLPLPSTADAAAPEPLTSSSADFPAELLPTLQRAWAGEALSTAEVWSLLCWWNGQKTVSLGHGAPRSPAPGSLYFLDPKDRYKQDGLNWKKEVHSSLVVDKEPRIKGYYASQVAPEGAESGAVLLQRRCYWDKNDKSVVMVHYVLATRAVGIKREAEEEAVGGDAGVAAGQAQSGSPPKRPRAAAAAASAPQMQPGVNLAATFPPPTAEQLAQVAAPIASASQNATLHSPGSPQAQLAALFAPLLAGPTPEPPTRTGRPPTNDWRALPLIMAHMVDSMSHDQASAVSKLVKVPSGLDLAIEPKTLRNRSDFRSLVPAHVNWGTIQAILGVFTQAEAESKLGAITWRAVVKQDHPDRHRNAALLAAVALSLQASPDLCYPGYNPLELADKVLDKLPVVRGAKATGKRKRASLGSAVPSSGVPQDTEGLKEQETVHIDDIAFIGADGSLVEPRGDAAVEMLPPQQPSVPLAPQLQAGPPPVPVWPAPPPQQQQQLQQHSLPWSEPPVSESCPPALISPLLGGPSAPSAPIPVPQPTSVPLQAASAPPAFLPPPGTVPPHVADQLRATDPEKADKKEISRAFRALHSCGIGGQAMIWAQREAYTTKSVPLGEVRFIYENVREHVLQGRPEEAEKFVQESMESFQGAAAKQTPVE